MYKLSLFYLILIFCFKTHQSLCITVLDSKKSFSYNQRDPNLKKYKDLINVTQSNIKRAYDSSIKELKRYPISSALTGVSLCVSSLVWSKCVNVNDIRSGPEVKSLRDLLKSVLYLFVIPEFNANSILRVLSFYLTVRRLESLNGFDSTLKMVSVDCLIGLLFSNFIIKKLNLSEYDVHEFDFNKFSTSLVSLSCFSSPEQPILAYGLLRTKNKYFPPLLVLSDYLFTLQTSNLLNSFIGVIYGLIALCTYNLLHKS